jgi:hypothetical protein
MNYLNNKHRRYSALEIASRLQEAARRPSPTAFDQGKADESFDQRTLEDSSKGIL